MIYVTLPQDFIAIEEHPGYFYKPSCKQVYSIKSGELKPLKVQRPNGYAPWMKSDYTEVSHRGKKYYIEISTLKDLPIKSAKVRIYDDF